MHLEPQKYLELYDTEKYLFSTVRESARKKGYLTFKEFFRIAMWKTARAKQHYLQNKGKVKKITKQALEITDDKSKIDKLCELKGVRVPVASAILTVVHPESYGVIDIRCVQMLNKSSFSISENLSSNTYIKYLSIIRKIASENKITPKRS